MTRSTRISKKMAQASTSLKSFSGVLQALGQEADRAAQSLRLFNISLAALSTIEDVITESFPELERHHDHQAGTHEYSNPQAARVHWAQVMRMHGYKPGGNCTWLKIGFAAVMEPN